MDNLPQQHTTIYEVENTKLMIVPNEGDAQVVFEKSVLQILQTESEGILIRVNDFEYLLFQETPIYLTAYQTYRSYILPYLEGNYAILLHNDIPEFENVYECLDLILANTSNLILNTGSKEQKLQDLRKSQVLLQQNHSFLTPGGDDNEDEKRENMMTPTGDEEVQKINSQIQKQQTMNQNQMSQKEQEIMMAQKIEEDRKRLPKTTNFIAKYINVGGSLISKGIQFGADVVHQGIQHTGNFIEKHVSKNKDLKVSDSTKGTVKFIKTVTGKAIQFTTFAATTIIDTTVKIGSMAVGAIIGKKQEPSRAKSLQYLREIASASVEATGSILDNLDQAANKIGKVINEQSTSIVKKKYGDDAAQVVNDSIGVVLDARGAYGDIKSLALKKVIQKTTKEVIKENI